MSIFLDPCTVYPEDFRYCPHGLKKSAGHCPKSSHNILSQLVQSLWFTVTVSVVSNMLHVDEKISLENTVRNDNRKRNIST